jgi:hypothetical protein
MQYEENKPPFPLSHKGAHKGRGEEENILFNKKAPVETGAPY